jgi:hypothetical protein
MEANHSARGADGKGAKKMAAKSKFISKGGRGRGAVAKKAAGRRKKKGWSDREDDEDGR